MLWNFLREECLFIWPQFVFSRDGIHYDRRFREPFIPLSPEPDYELRSYLCTAADCA